MGKIGGVLRKGCENAAKIRQTRRYGGPRLIWDAGRREAVLGSARAPNSENHPVGALTQRLRSPPDLGSFSVIRILP